MRYGDAGQHGREVFARGALSWPDGGIVLNEQHNRQAPIVRFVPVDDGDEVRIDVELPDTQRGRDAATMVRDGTMRGVSVEFRSEPGRHARRPSGKSPGPSWCVPDWWTIPVIGGSTVEVRADANRTARRRIWL